MTPEVGKWYWIRFGDDTVRLCKCYAVSHEGEGVFWAGGGYGGYRTREFRDVLSWSRAPRRWWQFWKRGRR